MKKPEIKISKPYMSDRQTIKNWIEIPKQLRKYLVTLQFDAAYDVPIDHVDESIQMIPALGSMLPLAWLAGADVKAGKIDRTFFDAMGKLQEKYKDLYPNGAFTTEIKADEIVENEIGAEGAALTFSGGVDSTYALASIIDEHPQLITLFRYTHKSWWKPFFDRLVVKFEEWAAMEALDFDIVDSNVKDILDHNFMNSDFEPVLGTTPWATVQQVINQTSVVAPLSIGRFNKLHIASTYSPEEILERHLRHSSTPSVDETVAWADLSVIHQGFISRFDKMSLILDFLDKTNFKLHVCLTPSTYGSRYREFDLNCGHCHKCVGTAILLLVMGRDPRVYGLPLPKDWNVFKRMIESLKKRDPYPELAWKRMQAMIPNKIEQDFNGSRKFLKWFGKQELELGQVYRL